MPGEPETPILEQARQELNEAVLEAVRALKVVAQSGEDAPRVKAATEILDRAGITSQKPTEQSVQFPLELMTGVVSIMASMFGVEVRRETLIRNATPVLAPSRAPLALQLPPEAAPTAAPIAALKGTTRKAKPKANKPVNAVLKRMKREADEEDAFDG